MDKIRRVAGGILAIGGTVNAVCEWTGRSTTSALIVGLLWISIALDGLLVLTKERV